jgi:hypothetical protein
MGVKDSKSNDNYNNINHIMESKQKKKYHRFPLITRMGTFGSKTKWKLCKDLTNYLSEFFTYKDMQIIGNVNICFRNIYVNYTYKWSPYLQEVIKSEYNIELPENQIDNTFNEANKIKRTYKIKNYDGLYLLIENNRLNIIKLAKFSTWAWKNDTRYWIESALSNSYLNDRTPKLKLVFWCDVNFSFNIITPNNFSLYLHQAFPSLEEESLDLDILVDGNKIYHSDYPNNQTGYKRGSVLEECYIYEIDIKDFNFNKNEHEIKVQFMHKHLYGIRGWYIDGAKLVEKYDMSLYFN